MSSDFPESPSKVTFLRSPIEILGPYQISKFWLFPGFQPCVVVRVLDVVEIFSDEVSRLVQGLGLQDDHVVALLQQVARPTDVDGSFLGKN